MIEDPTKDIGQKYETNPTLETILKEMRAGFAAVNARLNGIDARLDRMEAQLDRVTSVAHETRAELRELKTQLKEHFPSLIK